MFIKYICGGIKSWLMQIMATLFVLKLGGVDPEKPYRVLLK